MFHGAVILIVGACIQGFAFSGPRGDDRTMFIIGRFLLGFGIATCQTAGPSYVAEMAHPAWRGVLTGLFNCQFFVGGVSEKGIFRKFIANFFFGLHWVDSGRLRQPGRCGEHHRSTQIFLGDCLRGCNVFLLGSL